MTTLNEARAAVYDRFLTEWVNGGPGPLSPYTFDNEAFEPPMDADGRGEPWARCSVRSLTGTQQTLGPEGNRKYTRKALARVEVYGPPGTGLKVIDEHCQVALAMFEGRSLPGTRVMLHDAQVSEVGLVDEGRWFLSTVQATFDYEEIK